MAKLVVEVKIKDDVDESSFISEFDNIDEVSVKNTIPELPTLLVMYVEESYLSTLQSHPSVVCAVHSPPAYPAITYPNLPSRITLSNKTVSNYDGTTSGSPGTNYIPYQFYLNSDIIPKTVTGRIGAAFNNQSNRTKEDTRSYDNVTYSSNFTGKYIDIVTIEAGVVGSAYVGYQDSHPDFDDPDNTGNTRCVPKNWYGCEGASNNQVTSNSMFSAHGIGVLSAAGGLNCGFAKKSKLYATYLGGDTLTEICQAIVYFHNNKSNNPTTGLKDPTIVIGEFQYLLNTSTALKVDDIQTVVDPTNGTSTRPSSGWGSDLTPFTSRNIFPFQVQDPDDDSWHWMVKFPIQTQNDFFVKYPLDTLYDNGIVFINAAGNDGGTYVKESDARWNGTYCTKVSGTIDRYEFNRGAGTGGSDSTSKTTTQTTTWFPFIAYGPHGLDKAIDVAAGQNSETYPMLDGYSNRGPGVDIVGCGAETFTAYPLITMDDGNKWGDFSGTSCATPTVVGVAACLMEKYYVLNGVWPTPSQVKDILLRESINGNKRLIDPASTTWSNVPNAAENDIKIDQQLNGNTSSSYSLIQIKKDLFSLNGMIQFAELAGTPPRRAYLNTEVYNREQTKGQRPKRFEPNYPEDPLRTTLGVMYPRPRNISNIADGPRKE